MWKKYANTFTFQFPGTLKFDNDVGNKNNNAITTTTTTTTD